MASQEGFMKAYTTSTKSSSSTTEKHESKISHQFQLNKKSEIFEAVRVKKDALCKKSCQTYFLKKLSFSSFFKLFVVNVQGFP